ncbi:hypothetical protein ERO13_A03G047650v2 [Gossypium hirsutum]|uniref:Uncharacterized protein n=1 Tax=Gossypium barbadense TaxID=3634 RepID=A0A5J5WB93_GOSBA|nr:hypothetical protein ES319_A03G058100v1 [Gossypium barbadense]KAG4207128.1 hypothetical protein ERO13_A03G047650v2 [Gossypium hirsutum]
MHIDTHIYLGRIVNVNIIYLNYRKTTECVTQHTDCFRHARFRSNSGFLCIDHNIRSIISTSVIFVSFQHYLYLAYT